jgi:hypothetical protein
VRGGKRESAPALQGVTLASVTLRQGRRQNDVKEGDAPQAAIPLLDAFPWEGEVLSADAALLRTPFVPKVAAKKGAPSVGSSTINLHCDNRLRHGSGRRPAVVLPVCRSPTGMGVWRSVPCGVGLAVM